MNKKGTLGDMKKLCLGILIGAVLFSGAPLKASNLSEATLFPAALLINGVPAESDADLPILNYNGSAYVPVRMVGEALGARVHYLEVPERTISINDPRAELPKQYNEDLAIQNGDVVYLSPAKAYNEEQFTGFVSAVNRHLDAWVRVARYTIEGDPILQTVFYANGSFHYTYDASRDAFGAREIVESDCSSLVHEAGERESRTYTEYYLSGCGPDQVKMKLYSLYAR